MLVKKLIYMDRGLGTILSPPMPTREEDKIVWMPERRGCLTTPRLAQWDPPAWVKKSSTFFWLSENVMCSQRGYLNEDVYTEYLQAASVCFEMKADQMRRSISNLAFDFLITVMAPGEHVAAGCVVELRPAHDSKQPACLYISTLCTHPNFRKLGLARQMVHAVYTLGSMLLEQNAQLHNIWYNAIPSNSLFIGLHVRTSPKSETSTDPNVLLKMYGSCGLEQTSSYPKYESFTPYSRCAWEMDVDLERLAPMMQEVSSRFFYQDHTVSILHPSESEGMCMYHAFPAEFTDAIQNTGILYAKHNRLFNLSGRVYIPETITFSKTRPANACSFCIRVLPTKAGGTIELKISVPCFFSCAIFNEQGKNIKQPTQDTIT
jgi:hypothetical protein